MKPPYYHALVSVLKSQDRFGLQSESVEPQAEAIRKSCLDGQYGPQNRMAWAEFVTISPSDVAAKYMRQFVS